MRHARHSAAMGTAPRAIAVIAASAVFAVTAAELYLKARRPELAVDAGVGFFSARRRDTKYGQTYTDDPELGFRPILGTDQYDRFGTRVNNYGLSKRQGVTRLLFIGDSVTARGRIIAAVRRCYGDKQFEYWNAGVHGFNTVQEVGYYRKYNRLIQPDHVILTFHPNDYGTTPVVFRDSDERLVICSLRKPLRTINPWLFRRSYLYRLYQTLTTSEAGDDKGIRKEVACSLKQLREMVAADEATLTVLVFPYLAPPHEWGEWRLGARQTTLGLLEDLQVRHFDLLDVFLAALVDGVPTQERQGDTLHPSGELSERFAAYLHRHGLLDAE